MESKSTTSTKTLEKQHCSFGGDDDKKTSAVQKNCSPVFAGSSKKIHFMLKVLELPHKEQREKLDFPHFFHCSFKQPEHTCRHNSQQFAYYVYSGVFQ